LNLVEVEPCLGAVVAGLVPATTIVLCAFTIEVAGTSPKRPAGDLQAQIACEFYTVVADEKGTSAA
jgi:hypothetical protein